MKYNQTHIYEYDPGKSDTAYMLAREYKDHVFLQLISVETGLKLQQPISEPTAEKIAMEYEKMVTTWRLHVDNVLAPTYIKHQDILLNLGFEPTTQQP